MRRFIVVVFAVVGFVAVLGLLGIAAVVWKVTASRPALPENVILTADLTKGLVDGPGDEPLLRLLFDRKRTLRDFLEALDRAGGDLRVKGLYVRLGDDAMGLARVQEVRDAIRAFRGKGKFALAFADSFGEFGGGTRPYYLATAFDEIWLQPIGTVGLTGLRAEVPFFRGTLDKLGIAARFDHRSEYKSAANSLTETAMTPPQREETEALVTSMAGQIEHGIADARQLSQADVSALIDRAPLTAEEASAAKLVDHIGYRDEVVAAARLRAGSGAELVALSHYLRAAGHPHKSGPAIALIYGTGLITRDSGASSPLAGAEEASAQTIARAFRDAFRDSDVRAILLRIDSPGGSAVASETIWREVLRARERGKPVIVSMGDVAASGGYFIAAPADKIVAEPGTITGSIGVLAGKLVVAGLLQKLGITADSVQRGGNAGMLSALQDFSPEEHRRLEAFLDSTYAAFKNHVAAGRRLSAAAVEAVAKGRVWSGEEAKANGLVDELGGLATAIGLAKDAAKIPTDREYKLVVYPHEKSAAEILYDRLFEKDNEGAASSSGAAERLLLGLGSLLADIDALHEDNSVLHMPPLGEVR